MTSTKAKIAAVAAFAAAAGSALLFSTSAGAATTPAPAITNDPNASLGNLAFYDKAGNVVTSGNAASLKHMFDYAVASSAGRSNSSTATLYYAFPDHTKTDSQDWVSNQQNAGTDYPVTDATAPAVIKSQTNPVATEDASYANMNAAASGVSQDTTSGYQGIVQIRLYDSGIGAPARPDAFWATDVYYDANGWQQVYPKVVSTTTTVAANPASVTTGQSTTLTATVKDQDGTAVNDGTVQFQDGSTNIGSPVNVSAGSASTTTSFSSATVHTVKAVYSSSNSAHPTSSGSTTVTVTKAAAKATNTALSISGNVTTAGQGGVLTATVTDAGGNAVSAGTVAFYDNGSTTPLTGTKGGSGNTFTLTLAAPDFTAGGHSIVAKFTPADPDTYAASQSAASTFTTLAANDPCAGKTAGTCDNQSVTATIPAGSITITTPYTASNPLDLGTLALNSTGTLFTGSKTFENIVVTDTRSGAQGWTAKALANNMTSGANVINAQNLGLTGITSTPSAGFSGTVTPQDNAAANGVAPNDPGSAGLGGSTAHTIATADHGPGTVTMKGTLTLNAPTSTKAGVYNGVITFTVG